MMERKVKKKKAPSEWATWTAWLSATTLHIWAPLLFPLKRKKERKRSAVANANQHFITFSAASFAFFCSALLCLLSWSSVCSIANIALSQSLSLSFSPSKRHELVISLLFYTVATDSADKLQIYNLFSLSRPEHNTDVSGSYPALQWSRRVKKRRGEEKQNIDNLEV